MTDIPRQGLPLGYSYAIGQGWLHTIPPVGSHIPTVADSLAMLNAGTPIQRASVKSFMKTYNAYFDGDPSRTLGIGDLVSLGSSAYALGADKEITYQAVTSHGPIPEDTQWLAASGDMPEFGDARLADSSHPWHDPYATGYRRVNFYMRSDPSDAKTLARGFVIMRTHDPDQKNWDTFAENGKSAFWKNLGNGQYTDGDFNFNTWIDQNKIAIFDATVEVMGALVNYFTGGAASVIVNAVVTFVIKAVNALVGGDSGALINAFAGLAEAVISQGSAAIANLAQGSTAPIFHFVTTIGKDLKTGYDAASTTLQSLSASIPSLPKELGGAGIDQFAQTMINQVPQLASKYAPKTIPGVSGVIGAVNDQYIATLKQWAGVGAGWVDHGLGVDFTGYEKNLGAAAQRLLDIGVAVPDDAAQLYKFLGQAIPLPVPVPDYAKNYVYNGVFTAAVQAQQNGLLAGTPELKGPNQIKTARPGGGQALLYNAAGNPLGSSGSLAILQRGGAGSGVLTPVVSGIPQPLFVAQRASTTSKLVATAPLAVAIAMALKGQISAKVLERAVEKAFGK